MKAFLGLYFHLERLVASNCNNPESNESKNISYNKKGLFVKKALSHKE